MGDNLRKRRALRLRDGPDCYWCGAPGLGVTIDHVIPKSMGGSNRLENLVLACEPCNQARGGIHGPGAHQPGLPTHKANGHEKFVEGTVPAVVDPNDPRLEPPKPPRPAVTVSKVKIPPPGPRQKTITASDIRPEVADAFVDAIEAKEMEAALRRLESKYGSAVKWKPKKEDA